MKEVNPKSENTIFALFVSIFSMCVGFLLGVLVKLNNSNYPNHPLESPNQVQGEPVLIDWKTNTPVRVILVDESKLTSTEVKHKTNFRAGILLIAFLTFLVAITISARYGARTIQTSINTDPSTGVQFTVNYPVYYSIGDKTQIQVSVHNNRNVEVSNLIVVVEPNLENRTNTEIEDSNRIDFGTLLPGEIKSKEITFVVREPLGKFPKKKIVITTKAENQQEILREFGIKPLPIPYFNSTLTVLYASALLWATLGLFYRDTLSLAKLFGAPLVAILFDLLLSIIANLLTDVLKNAATGNFGG